MSTRRNRFFYACLQLDLTIDTNVPEAMPEPMTSQAISDFREDTGAIDSIAYRLPANNDMQIRQISRMETHRFILTHLFFL